MRGFWSVITLVIVGVIIADLATHPTGVGQAGTSLNTILNTTYGAMLGGGK